MKLPTIKDLKLNKRNETKVKVWLETWLNHFIELANGEEGNVRRANFEEMDFFYFTDCRDLVSKEVESTGQEQSLKMRRRKRMILFQLMLKNLLGRTTYTPVPCSHCGYKEIYFGGVDGGHFDYCPKCGKTNVCTYPNFYDEAMKLVVAQLIEKKLLPQKEYP